MNTLCGAYATTPPAELKWIVANFLLARGAQSYLAVLGPGDSGKLLDLSALDLPVGKPTGEPRSEDRLMVRDYERGMVAVNPSSRNTVALKPPAGSWTVSGSGAVAQELSLPPRSGLVLLKENPR